MKRKHALSFVLAILMFFNFYTFNSSAKSINTEKTSPTFIARMDEYFNHPERFEVLNKDGENITAQFYTQNIDYYLDSNFVQIDRNAQKSVSAFCETIVKDEPSPRAYNRTYITKKFDHIATTVPIDHGFDIHTTVTASINYNTTTGKISDFSGPTMSITYEEWGIGWNFWTKNPTTKGVISADRYKVNFTVIYQIGGAFIDDSVRVDVDVVDDSTRASTFNDSFVGYPA